MTIFMGPFYTRYPKVNGLYCRANLERLYYIKMLRFISKSTKIRFEKKKKRKKKKEIRIKIGVSY